MLTVPHIPPRDCLRQVINYSEEPEVGCPFRDDSYACSSHLQEREIRAVSGARGQHRGAWCLGGCPLTLPHFPAGVPGGVPALPGAGPGAGGAAHAEQLPLPEQRLPRLVHLRGLGQRIPLPHLPGPQLPALQGEQGGPCPLPQFGAMHWGGG